MTEAQLFQMIYTVAAAMIGSLVALLPFLYGSIKANGRQSERINQMEEDAKGYVLQIADLSKQVIANSSRMAVYSERFGTHKVELDHLNGKIDKLGDDVNGKIDKLGEKMDRFIEAARK